MANYNSINCPICDKRFNDNDDIVVCPQCGAPHHRECWFEHGECQFEQLHNEGFVWKHPEVEFSREDEKNTNDRPVACVRCGAVNEAGRLFCKNCGVALSNTERPQSPFENGFPQPVLIDFNDPLGGATEDENFDGVTAKELAGFIGMRSNYFMRIFKMFKDRGRQVFFSAAAFLFTGCWFISKKMYKLGFVLSALMVALYCTWSYINEKFVLPFKEATEKMTVSEYFEYTAKLSPKTVIAISSYSALVVTILTLMILCGFYANKLYKNHCIKTIKSANQDDAEAMSVLNNEKGGINMAMAITVFLCQFLLVCVFRLFFIQ